jgi:thiol-disulfide isomerase/thioredoxin
MNIKKISYEIATTLLLILVVSNIVSCIRQPKLDSNILPKIQAKFITNDKFDSSKMKDITIIHFWALWCPTCKLETSNIQSISKDVNVITIAVNSGSDKDIQEFMTKNKLTFKVINDSQSKLANRFNVEMFPTTFIYDKNQELKFSEVGYTSTAGLKARIQWIKRE